jgi:hypothetical protein
LPSPPNSTNPADETLTDLEKAVNSPHLQSPQLGDARDEVVKAFQNGADPAPGPIKALNARPLGEDLHKNDVPPQPAGSPLLPFDPNSPESSTTNPTPGPTPDSLSPSPGINDPKAPPVPPPIPFKFGNDKTPPNGPPPAQ